MDEQPQFEMIEVSKKRRSASGFADGAGEHHHHHSDDSGEHHHHHSDDSGEHHHHSDGSYDGKHHHHHSDGSYDGEHHHHSDESGAQAAEAGERRRYANVDDPTGAKRRYANVDDPTGARRHASADSGSSHRRREYRDYGFVNLGALPELDLDAVKRESDTPAVPAAVQTPAGADPYAPILKRKYRGTPKRVGTWIVFSVLAAALILVLVLLLTKTVRTDGESNDSIPVQTDAGISADG